MVEGVWLGWGARADVVSGSAGWKRGFLGGRGVSGRRRESSGDHWAALGRWRTRQDGAIPAGVRIMVKVGVSGVDVKF